MIVITHLYSTLPISLILPICCGQYFHQWLCYSVFNGMH